MLLSPSIIIIVTVLSMGWVFANWTPAEKHFDFDKYNWQIVNLNI